MLEVPFPFFYVQRMDTKLHSEGIQLGINDCGQSDFAGMVHITVVAFPHDPHVQVILAVPVIVELADDDGAKVEVGLEPAVEGVADDGGNLLGGVFSNRGHG